MWTIGEYLNGDAAVLDAVDGKWYGGVLELKTHRVSPTRHSKTISHR